MDAVLRLHQVKQLAFGAGVVMEVAGDLAEAGCRSTIIVTAPPVRGHADKVAEEIRSRGGKAAVWDECNAEPAIADFDRVVQVAREMQADSVIGLGGGSSMDLAKLVAALANSNQTIAQVSGTNRLNGRALWLACVPTTAGTGSEVSNIAILLDEDDLLKKGVVSPHLVPDAAYVDPLLMVSMPPSVTAATGLDALTHCIEAYANKFAHPVIDTFALEGIRLIGRNLLRAIEDGTDLDARMNMARGSLYGGICLGPVNTGAVHALSYPLGGEFHVAHGVSNAVLLPHVLAFNLDAAPDRYADIALALGAEPSNDKAELARRGLDLIESFCRDCGISMRMRDYGVPVDALDRMTDSAMTVTRLLDRNVREVTWQDARKIYEAAF